MIRTVEIEKRNGQIQFSRTVLEPTQLRSKLKLVDANPVSSMPPKQNQSLWLSSACRMLIRHLLRWPAAMGISALWLFEQ